MKPLGRAAGLVALPVRAAMAVALAALAAATQEPRHWAALADQLGHVAAALPMAVLHRAHGQALRSGQRPAEAVTALRRGLALSPDDPALLRELGRALRLAGQWEEAIAALRQSAGRGHGGAVSDLLRLGQRAALPVPQPGGRPRQAWAELADDVPRPPPTPAAALFRIRVTGGSAVDSPLVQSLAAQAHAAWCLDTDEREKVGDWPGLAIYDLPLPAQACLHPQALAWLNQAAARTSAAVLRSDHDHVGADGRRCDPWLLPQGDRLWLEATAGVEARRAAAQTEAAGPAAHVPLVLATLPAVAMPARALPDAEPQKLSIIIPTRDNPGLLDAAITSLRATASRRDLLEIVIVDNGSRLPATRALLTRLAAEPGVRIVPFDEPFNWSRASNLGAAAASADRLLFLNDDTEMQTAGWDRILAGLLADARVGAVGARMLYPDGRIQHAGFVFGMDNGPQHDGRWRDGSDPGPAGRWTAIREAVAVTGAFIAISRADFAGAGGFDEAGLAIDFADVDLCLKLRARSRIVAYCGAITLLHHESVSRGLNVSRAQRRRMRREWALLQARWGDAVRHDPFHHPAWARTGVPHDGLRQPTMDEVMTWSL
jgi:GT2 family glycosyltransferase/tetratricopeptide (TPR) repeat protein